MVAFLAPIIGALSAAAPAILGAAKTAGSAIVTAGKTAAPFIKKGASMIKNGMSAMNEFSPIMNMAQGYAGNAQQAMPQMAQRGMIQSNFNQQPLQNSFNSNFNSRRMY